MPHTLRPINVARINPDDPRILSPARNDSPTPQSIPVYLVSDGKIIGANPSPVILQAPPVHMPLHVIDDGGEDYISGKKVKLLCSYGGKILPRPSDGMLRYVGGQTRIITVRRDVGFNELVQKMVNACGQVAVMKYQLPNEDLDALVSVSCADDLENMMEEYDKLLERSIDGSLKLRVFLFTASELDSSGMMHFNDVQDSSQKYVDAVNGVMEVGCVAMEESILSATSTPNSDISVADANDPSPRSDGTDVALRSGCFDANLATLGYDLQQTAIKAAAAPYLQGLMDAPQDTIGAKEYQMFPSHLIYSNPAQAVAAATRPVLVYPQHHEPQTFVPSAHMSVNPTSMQATYKAQVPYVPQLMPYQQLTIQKDDCTMCQKQLPHAHSDTMVQEQRSAAINDVNTIYQSLQLDDAARLHPVKDFEAQIEGQRIGVKDQIIEDEDIVDQVANNFYNTTPVVISEANEVHAMVSPNDLETMFANRTIQSSMAASTLGGIHQEYTNTLFNNNDPWSFLQDSPLPPIPSKIVTRKELLAPMDPLLDNSPSKDVELIQEQMDDNLEQVMCNKDSSDLIKLKLQPITEEGMASVLESPIIDADIFVPDANQEKDIQFNIDVIIQAKLEGMNVKSEKTNLAFPRDDGLGRLQIIKNIDLEELRELGSGTFGIVYHGKWRGTDVAIKRINNRCFAGKPSEQERMIDDFWNEAIKLAALHHPNVVAFYGVVLDGPGGSVATVTEYMVNGSLRTALQKNERTLDKRKRLLIAMDVAFGMEYLHSRNIVHFDLKSDNLLVNLRDTQRPICKVGDLGLSKVKCQTLISGGVRGTLPWMAPELLNGSSSLVSEKVDVFSFGIVMWELLTGEEPYGDLHYGAIIGGIVSNTLRPTMPDNCDPDWRLLMEKCWSAEPSERPSFTEITDELRLMAAKLPSKAQASSPRTNAGHAN